MKTKVPSETYAAASSRFFYNQETIDASQLPESMAVFDVEYAELLQPNEHHIIYQSISETEKPKSSITLVYGSNLDGSIDWQLIEARFGQGRTVQALKICQDGLLHARRCLFDSQGRVRPRPAVPSDVAADINATLSEQSFHQTLQQKASILHEQKAVEQAKLEALMLETPRRFVSESMLQARRQKQAKVLATIAFSRYSKNAVII